MNGEPFCILIAALGGEGGGVLMNWIVGAARAAGLPVQATSVPGVAQRTGSTSYYIEMLREPLPAGQKAVFALVPMPGRVDVVIASEAVEAGRLMERGFVSPTRTTLILSTSRVYATAEKIQMGDGRFAAERVIAAAAKLARRSIALDLDDLARKHNTMVSATMFGALAGAGALPWARAISEAMIGSGRADEASRAGFAAAFAAAGAQVKGIADGASGLLLPFTGEGPAGDEESSSALIRPSAALGPPSPVKKNGRRESAGAATNRQAQHDPDARIARLPRGMREVARLGLERAIDFQDAAYGTLYLDRLERLAGAVEGAPESPETAHALEEAARRLALWMAYEDVARVADLKTRPERFARIRAEAKARPGEIVHVIDYLKPGGEELAAILPKRWGERLNARLARGKSLPFLGRGIRLKSSGVFGFWVLRLLSRGRRFRRGSLRWSEEQTAIERWLDAMEKALAAAPQFAGALAELPRLLKGYSDTHARGRANYAAIFERIVAPALAGGALADAASGLRNAMAAALADPEGAALTQALGDAQGA